MLSFFGLHNVLVLPVFGFDVNVSLFHVDKLNGIYVAFKEIDAIGINYIYRKLGISENHIQAEFRYKQSSDFW